MLRSLPYCRGGAATMMRAPRLFTVAPMTAKRDDRASSAVRQAVSQLYDGLRLHNARRADLARAREMRTRIERAVEAARRQTIRDRG
jgi:hypothetical protein